jgi:hypothetical protein
VVEVAAEAEVAAEVVVAVVVEDVAMQQTVLLKMIKPHRLTLLLTTKTQTPRLRLLG